MLPNEFRHGCRLPGKDSGVRSSVFYSTILGSAESDLY
jgi:hypothetical protein